MPIFDMVVVGSGGGPDETNLSAYVRIPPLPRVDSPRGELNIACRRYLVKSRDTAWKDGILALEAGSGQGALTQLLLRDPRLFNAPEETTSKPHSASEIYSFVRSVSISSIYGSVYRYVPWEARSYLISHAHLDHVNSLVLSAGSLRGPRKRIYAAKQTLQDLESVFSDRIWPNLASWNEDDEDHKLLYTT